MVLQLAVVLATMSVEASTAGRDESECVHVADYKDYGDVHIH